MNPTPVVTPELKALLRRVKLGRCLDTLPERLALAATGGLGHAEFLELVLADEVSRRETSSAALRARTAGLDPAMTLDRCDDTAQITYDRNVWNELCSLRFVESGHNALILGPVGVGKTFLATAPGRLVVGHWRRRLVMTEAERYGKRRGVRGGVLLFGPSQSGKTTRLIESVNHWAGPAIISSVKTDLLRATIEHRSSVGEVKVFDPIGLTGRPASTWSPLHGAETLSGSLLAAQLLARASGDDGPADRFWRGQAEQLLAAMLWTAANAEGHRMRHVVRWVVEMDRPTDDDPGTLAPLVRLLTDHDDETIAADARQVQGWLHGQWGTDPRTSSSIYTTARNAVWSWTDPGLAASADGCDITLDWLTVGNNTLYLSAPLGDEGRLGVVFSVLLQDLIGQAFVRANRGETLADRRLLVVLDEAANTPLPKLPQWAATVTGAGIQLVTVWQSKAQLDQAYGKDADNVLTNHRSKLIFPSGLSDLATIDYISAIVGDEHVRGDLDEPSAFHPDDRRSGRSPATAVRLLPPNVLRQMQIGDALLLHGQLPPAWLRSRH